MINHTTISKIWHKALTDQESLTPEEIYLLIDLFNKEDGVDIIEKEVYADSVGINHTKIRRDYAHLYYEIDKRIKRKRTPVRLMQVFTKIAAAIAIPLIGFSLYFLLTQNHNGNQLQEELSSVWKQEYIVPIGVKSKIILGDSTIVWLNSGSRLLVDNNFGNGKRLVNLNGEGYFQVKSDKKSPFIVRAKKLDIEVTGTEFNVSAYLDSDKTEAVLINGEIKASSTSTLFSGMENTITMRPLQKLTMDETHRKVVIENNIAADRYSSWKDNLMIFTDTPVKDVAITLERWYNVKVIITSPELEKCLLTGKFENRTLEQILKFLKMTLPLDYKYKDDVVTLSYK